MRTWRSWMIRLGGLFGKQRRETEMSQAIQSHREMHVADPRITSQAKLPIKVGLFRVGTPFTWHVFDNVAYACLCRNSQEKS